MIVSDDKACRLPAVHCAMRANRRWWLDAWCRVPYPIVPVYAALLIALGWFAGEQWRNPPCHVSVGCAGGACGTGANGFLSAKRGEAGSRCGT
ncbi:Uncharacterised protein [Raoultella planticola]|uniref:Uncharacterized protein n=1 Tax=Raoultella planticola TaxID=575 RepID=A0A485B309_RAOPL|nr:Uncharacterised protein [Raoultella planticola]